MGQDIVERPLVGFGASLQLVGRQAGS
jgi:hypothetical protein